MKLNFTEQYVDKLENKLIRDNKKADKWRKKAKTYVSAFRDEVEFFNIVVKKYEEERSWVQTFKNKFKEANLKQKKAWIAFSIATILYIVGIVILI